jgi:hypothetical protein
MRRIRPIHRIGSRARRAHTTAQRHRAFLRRLCIGSPAPGRIARLALILRGSARAFPVTRSWFAPLALSPRITLVTSIGAPARTLVHRTVVAATQPSRTESGKPVLERRLVVERSHSTLVERMVRTELALRRSTTTTVQRHDHFHRIEAPSAYRRVVQTLVRIQPPAAARVEPVAAPPTTPGRPRFDVHPAVRGSAPSSRGASDDLRRVTDHVIAEFDRRVLSYRERTGH